MNSFSISVKRESERGGRSLARSFVVARGKSGNCPLACTAEVRAGLYTERGQGCATVLPRLREAPWAKSEFGFESDTWLIQWSRSALYCPFVLKRAFLSPKILYCSFKDSL